MSISIQSLIALAEEYATPLYVYDAELIKQRFSELTKAFSFKRLKIFYAMKANYNPAILKLIHNLGGCIDAVSLGDLLLAIKVGFKPEQILYTANNITDQEMHAVHAYNVLLNIDSLSRLEKFGRAYPGSAVCLRFNPEVVAGANEKVQTAGALTKFGLLLEDIKAVQQIVGKYSLKVVGLHEHTGSGISEIEKYLEAVSQLLDLASLDSFPDLRFLDFGGGFAVPYRSIEARIDYQTFGKTLTSRFVEFCEQRGQALELYFEPGRYIVAESGQLIVRVNTLKRNRSRRIAGTDSGFPQLIRPVLYDAYHELLNLSNPEGSKQTYDVCGNICESGDNFAVDRQLPEIREGDLLAIQNAGAYCYAMGGVYNLRSMPAEVLVEGAAHKLIRRRLSTEELVNSILEECR